MRGLCEEKEVKVGTGWVRERMERVNCQNMDSKKRTVLTRRQNKYIIDKKEEHVTLKFTTGKFLLQ